LTELSDVQSGIEPQGTTIWQSYGIDLEKRINWPHSAIWMGRN
jgi:hypothetical protein